MKYFPLCRLEAGVSEMSYQLRIGDPQGSVGLMSSVWGEMRCLRLCQEGFQCQSPRSR